MKELLFFFFFLFTLNLGFTQNSNILLKTDFDGNVIEGSIEYLIVEIQKGSAIRVGWQLDFDKDKKSDLDHWIDANFISILNGHVFNQIEPIYRQIPKSEIPQIQIISSPMMWTGIIGTNGKLVHRYIIEDIDKIEDEAVRARLEKTAAVKEIIVATIWTKK